MNDILPDPLPDAEWYRTSDGVDLPYWTRGEGPVLLLVHGWSQTAAMFGHQFNALAANFRVVVPELRGHGLAAGVTRGLRLSRLGQDLHELIVCLGADRVHLLGWSMGAAVVWSYIGNHGLAGVDRLVLVDQPPMVMARPDMAAETAAEYGTLFTPSDMLDLYRSFLSTDGESTRAAFVAGMLTPSAGPRLHEWILAENGRTPLPNAAILFMDNAAADWRDVIASIDRPTMIIAGAGSIVPAISQRWIHRHVVGSRYVELTVEEGGGHYPFLERPRHFNDIIKRFFSI